MGMCRESMRQFFFDRKTSSCKPFNYRGCGGNTNRFDSYAQCERVCVQKSNTGQFQNTLI